jgi:glycosyltransferase involved in cell wall biosynthesis
VSLRIGIDARAAAEVPAGRGRVLRELLRALARRDDDHGYLLYARTTWADDALDERFRWRTIEAGDPVWNILAARRASAETDVFYSVNSYLSAWFTTVPTILNVFDLIAWEAPADAQKRAALIERLTLRPALRRADVVVCNSASTQRDLLRHWPHAEPKTEVVPLAASDEFGRDRSDAELAATRARLGLDGRFVLSVGTIEPRKNLERLIDAFERLSPELRAGLRLAVVGPAGWDDERILARARATDGVVLLGHVSDADLASLYKLCEAFCYPSLYEGFGLPVVEALSAGAAVITSGVSSLPEVAGDAALYVDPHDVGSIHAALERLLTSEDARRRLRDLAPAQARRFSWDATAAQFVDAFAGAARTRS